MKVNWKHLIISLAISLGIGGLAGILTSNSMDVYSGFVKPPLSPPGIAFPIVWTILFTLMGISAYLIYESNSEKRDSAIQIYALQLLLNFSWSIVFFNLQNQLLAFFVLIALWICILIMILRFTKINKTAGYLQIPYLLWVTFAGYLNLAIYLLNK
ncbi:integral membrane protein [Lachnospiraceae bacterium KM106-2]|nr:integral membrane protein [Lachnospiraceae bacterium KM106-2]